jgi:hypothetical protein
MSERTAWDILMEISQIVDTAYGLATLADYECFESLSQPEERDAARRAPMAAARVLLARACQLTDECEPLISRMERKAV